MRFNQEIVTFHKRLMRKSNERQQAAEEIQPNRRLGLGYCNKQFLGLGLGLSLNS